MDHTDTDAPETIDCHWPARSGRADGADPQHVPLVGRYPVAHWRVTAVVGSAVELAFELARVEGKLLELAPRWSDEQREAAIETAQRLGRKNGAHQRWGLAERAAALRARQSEPVGAALVREGRGMGSSAALHGERRCLDACVVPADRAVFELVELCIDKRRLPHSFR
jgi:hypothetical protein